MLLKILWWVHIVLRKTKSSLWPSSLLFLFSTTLPTLTLREWPCPHCCSSNMPDLCPPQDPFSSYSLCLEDHYENIHTITLTSFKSFLTLPSQVRLTLNTLFKNITHTTSTTLPLSSTPYYFIVIFYFRSTYLHLYYIPVLFFYRDDV